MSETAPRRIRHENLPFCERCEMIMAQAHPALQSWFESVRSVFLDAHVSTAFRDAVAQEDAFKRGVSKVRWPNSKHNAIPARAIDLFQLDQNGKAKWDGVWFARLWATAKHPDLVWGGNWKTFKDAPHFQLVEEVPQP